MGKPDTATRPSLRYRQGTGSVLDITPELVKKVRSLIDYGLTFKEVGQRLGIGDATAHKIYNAK
jgi:hypothetical protein